MNEKGHVLGALDSSGVYRPGVSILDVGAGHGFLDAYLMGRYGCEIVGLELARSYQCREVLASPVYIHFYDGRHLALAGRPIPPRAFDAVSLLSVLHHAASATPTLLQQAEVVARRWIVVLEDLGKPLPKSTYSQASLNGRNRKHDPTGIFRSEQEWRRLFRELCPSFVVVREGLLPQRNRTKTKNGLIYTRVGGVEHRMFQKWWVLERAHVLGSAVPPPLAAGPPSMWSPWGALRAIFGALSGSA